MNFQLLNFKLKHLDLIKNLKLLINNYLLRSVEKSDLFPKYCQ